MTPRPAGSLSPYGARARRLAAAVTVVRVAVVTVVFTSVLTALACKPEKPNLELRERTEHFAFRISVDPTPPVSEGVALYKIVAQDKDTGEPIQTGQGRIFASNIDHASTYDGLVKGTEIGTYYARLRFPVADEWAVSLQFRRDSLSPLERTEDWRQGVLAPAPLGAVTDTTTSH